MFLKSRDVAVLGIFMALGVILISLGGYFEGSTLFFLAAASFLAGVAYKNISFVASVCYIIGTFLVGLILAPQKIYCITFVMLCIYICVAQSLEDWRYKKLSGDSEKYDENVMAVKVRNTRIITWIIKTAVYNIMLVAAWGVLRGFFNIEDVAGQALKSFFDGMIPMVFVIVCIIIAEVCMVVFDFAYFFFMGKYAEKIRMRKE